MPGSKIKISKTMAATLRKLAARLERQNAQSRKSKKRVSLLGKRSTKAKRDAQERKKKQAAQRKREIKGRQKSLAPLRAQVKRLKTWNADNIEDIMNAGVFVCNRRTNENSIQPWHEVYITSNKREVSTEAMKAAALAGKVIDGVSGRARLPNPQERQYIDERLGGVDGSDTEEV